MLMIGTRIQLLHPQAVIPTRGSEGAAGYDISCVAGLQGLTGAWSADQKRQWEQMEGSGSVTLPPRTGFIFRTGIAQSIPPGHVCLLWDRSGMGAKKQVGRLAGVIDSDYIGEWFVRLVNHSSEFVKINVGDKIVQGIYQEFCTVAFTQVDTLEATVRGTAGFGSTDRVT